MHTSHLCKLHMGCTTSSIPLNIPFEQYSVIRMEVSQSLSLVAEFSLLPETKICLSGHV